jgi:GT2 family glycosyltransferase
VYSTDNIFIDGIPSVDKIKESYYSYIPASFLLVRRKSIGTTLFPKEFFMRKEDNELCYRIWSRGYYVKLIPIVVCKHEFETVSRVASKTNPFLRKMLTYNFAKNSALLLSVYRKFLPKTYALQLSVTFLYRPIIDSIHLSQYLKNLLNKEIYYFKPIYEPLETFIYLKYSIKNYQH